MSEDTKRIRSTLYANWGMAEDTFAPIPEPKTNQWLNLLIDLLTIGTLTTAAPFFNGFLKQLASFSSPGSYNNVKDITLNLIGQIPTLAKDMLNSPDPDKWTLQEQNKFSNYVGQVIFGWMNITESALGRLFDGNPESIKALSDAMANGQLVEGRRERGAPKDTTATELHSNVLKSFFGFSIPILWRRSKTYAFVIDSGASCDGRPLSKYLNDSTADNTGVCYQGRRYYLVHPDGEARPCKCEKVGDYGTCQRYCWDNKFAPVGLADLGRFGGVTKEDLVIGSNIEGDASTEFTHRITGHREILSYGTCAFGIERTGGTGGAVEFKVGGQDVIDIINDSVKKFGGRGKVGARGVMPCDGTTVGTTVDVLWGIYHTG
ncbi:hypothetical protein VTI74DRAFT_3432 [Chaetomium olivicolor]